MHFSRPIILFLCAEKSPDCKHIWSAPMYDMKMSGGVPAHELSFAECKAHCIRISKCIGVDMDASPHSAAFCWLSIKDTSLSPRKGSTHISLTRTGKCKTYG